MMHSHTLAFRLTRRPPSFSRKSPSVISLFPICTSPPVRFLLISATFLLRLSSSVMRLRCQENSQHRILSHMHHSTAVFRRAISCGHHRGHKQACQINLQDFRVIVCRPLEGTVIFLTPHGLGLRYSFLRPSLLQKMESLK